LPAYLADTRKARLLGADGVYTHVHRTKGVKSFSVQDHLMELAQAPVNGSGVPRPQVTMAYEEPELKPHAVAAAELSELEAQDSINASV